MTIHPPGQTIGIIGGGQLGRMLAVAARRTGYLTTVLEPHPGGPAAQVCDREINLPFSAPEVLENFAGRVDVATIEFENIPAPALEAIASRCELHPKPEIAAICRTANARNRGSGTMVSPVPHSVRWVPRKNSPPPSASSAHPAC